MKDNPALGRGISLTRHVHLPLTQATRNRATQHIVGAHGKESSPFFSTALENFATRPADKTAARVWTSADPLSNRGARRSSSQKGAQVVLSNKSENSKESQEDLWQRLE